MNPGPSIAAWTRRLLSGEPLVKALHPAELPEILGGRPWICGLASLSGALAGLDAPKTARALGLPPGHLGPDGSILLIELPFPAEILHHSVRIPRARPDGPMQMALSPLRRADGSPAGIYRGSGLGPPPWELPEILLSRPVGVPDGARVLRRDRRDRTLATLREGRWMPSPALAPLEAAYVFALSGILRDRPTLVPARDEPAAERFSFALSPAYQDEIQAILARGTLFAAATERLARFDWIQVATTEGCQTWQHATGVFLEVWLQEGRVTDASLIDGDEARRMDQRLGSWHRQGLPLLELRDSVELSYVEGQAPGPTFALELAPDGWGMVSQSAEGVERRWAGRVEPAMRERVLDALQRTGFPRSPSRTSDRRITLAADGRSQSAVLADSGPYSTLLAELAAVRQAIAGGR